VHLDKARYVRQGSASPHHSAWLCWRYAAQLLKWPELLMVVELRLHRQLARGMSCSPTGAKTASVGYWKKGFYHSSYPPIGEEYPHRLNDPAKTDQSG